MNAKYQWFGITWVALLCLVPPAPFAAAPPAEVKAYRGQIDIPTYPWWPAVRHPYFRGTDGRNIYPYPMLDNLSRQKQPHRWQTVVLENEYLRVTFLPELGGRVYDVLDKTSGQPVFYVNHVVKPGLIGQCGAWISGGIEFNTGPAGHTVSAVMPVDVQILPSAPDGSRAVAVGEVEKINRTHWTVVLTLRPGRSFLEERVRIYNPTETARPYYFWNCTAVPNPPGFRFIYPMTLGTDHGGTTFYTWPVADGRDLSRGKTYQDASSIFAYQCDQDFFGSYDEEADRGVVAFANHHQLSGKKAWTWGHGSYGTMHQMDLTDTDGPYNEVQTGPLPTQADVGRLDPSEAVQWQEWWYPVRGLGGFTFANRDLAARASVQDHKLKLRLLGTGTWSPVSVRLLEDNRAIARADCTVSPQRPTVLELPLARESQPLEVEIAAPQQTLARFRVPLDLPVRQPPAKRPSPRTSAELVQAGWQDYLFARFPEAERHFKQALEKEAKNPTAHAGLAYLNLDRDFAAAAHEAKAALETDPDFGPAHFALAVAEHRAGNPEPALEAAWKAALDPSTAIPARALVAKVLLRRGEWGAANQALAEPGPWQGDALCRNRQALALHLLGEKKSAVRLAEQNLREDPLDAFARSILWLARLNRGSDDLAGLVGGKAQAVLDLAAEYAELGQGSIALRVITEFYLKLVPENQREPMPCYWAAYLSERANESGLPRRKEEVSKLLSNASRLSPDGVFPHRLESVPVLELALKMNPEDGKAALYLGHLLFSLGRHEQGRAMWTQAAKLGAAPAIAYRALGMAALNLDSNPETAANWLQQAHSLEPSDPIAARDLARVLFTLADKAPGETQKNGLITRARDTLKAAFPAGRGRSDFVSLLARAHNRLQEHAETARLLDSVRITIWEGAREAHDLFEEAHLALGQAHLKAGRPQEALAEFNRALEYPENLATGKLENTREAHVHYARGNALAALGQKAAAIQAWKQAADEPATNETKKEEARRLAREALQKAGAS